MLFLCRGVGHSISGTHIAYLCRRTLSSTTGIQTQYPATIGSGLYQEGDRVFAHYKEGAKLRQKLLQPLKAGSTTRTQHTNYEIKHSDIIGKPNGRLYVSPTHTDSLEKHKTAWRITQPTFDDFVSLAPRSVTPIYASYAASIVDLLDIHVSPPQPSNDPITSGIPPFEILEAGTGHGSLTIHLSRVIAAANPSCPVSKEITDYDRLDEVWSNWRSSRRAVIHTVEFDQHRSKETAALIQSFRGGLYWPHIDFHTGDVGEWVKQEQDKRQTHASPEEGDPGQAKEFLDIAILDLPGVHEKLESVVQAMKGDAQLLVYAPQITQLIACQRELEQKKYSLMLDRVLELGEGISNGRVWDLRFVRTRSDQRLAQANPASKSVEESSLSTDPNSEIQTATSADPPMPEASTSDFPAMVCRPMVGRYVMGGAFIALWRKKPDAGHSTSPLQETSSSG